MPSGRPQQWIRVYFRSRRHVSLTSGLGSPLCFEGHQAADLTNQGRLRILKIPDVTHGLPPSFQGAFQSSLPDKT